MIFIGSIIKEGGGVYPLLTGEIDRIRGVKIVACLQHHHA